MILSSLFKCFQRNLLPRQATFSLKKITWMASHETARSIFIDHIYSIVFLAALFRYNGMSFVYLVCLLLIPLIRSPSRYGTSKVIMNIIFTIPNYFVFIIL